MDEFIQNNNIKEVIEAKKHAEKILRMLESVSKHVKQTKQSRKVMKALRDFIKCNITNPAVFKKYSEVITILQESASGSVKNER